MANREIKFRAWDTYAKEMKLPTLMRLSRGLPFTDDNNNGKVFQIQCNGQENIEYFGDSCILMQYTGLKDKNGKDIYEGDILKTSRGVYAVVYDKYQFALDGFYCASNDVPGDYFSEQGWDEVIGNIYEHPHLLKEDTQHAQP